MKITQEDPNILVVENKNLFGIIAGIIFFGAGVVVLFLSIEQKLWIAGFLLLFGGLVIVLWSQIKVIFDKSQGQIFVSQKGIFKRKEENYGFSEIKEVIFREWEEIRWEERRDSVGPERMLVAAISLLKNDGREIVIYSGSRQGRGGLLNFGSFFAGARARSREEEVAEKIAAFLNVPLKRQGLQGAVSEVFDKFKQNPPGSTPPESGGWS